MRYPVSAITRGWRHSLLTRRYSSRNPDSVKARLACAFSLGFLLGSFTGLSASPVVGSILTIIAAGALAVLEIHAPASGEAASGRRRISPQGYAAVAMFAAAVVISAPLGVWTRAHELLGPSLIQQKNAWMSLGFSEGESRKLVVAQRLNTASEDGEKRKPGSSGAHPWLFSAPGSALSDLDPRQYRGNVDEMLRAFRSQRGVWLVVADIVDKLPADQRQAVLQRFYDQAVQSERP